MRVKAIKDLSQLDDEALFAEVETGATLCISNARQIFSDSLPLDDLKLHAGREILRLAAEEEAAKALILLDAVRCPRIECPTEFSRQLRYFNDHLAKGIYAQYSWRNPHTFLDVRQWVDRERKQYYLDGPNGVDWIFYNGILHEREGAIYVDYMENDDGNHIWHAPQRTYELSTLSNTRDSTLKLVSALLDAGCFKADALKIIAATWRAQEMGDSLTSHDIFDLNNKTLEKLHSACLLQTADSDVVNEIANRWLFPLYPLNLTMDEVDKNELREIQRNWNPDGFI